MAVDRHAAQSMNPFILVADDDRDIQEMISRNLISAGFPVIRAEDGADALSKARTQHPALAVLDVMMPGLSGLDVCRLLKADHNTSNIAIMMVTARSEEIDRLLGFELGADDYVTKPFSPRELVLRIRSILRRKSEPEAKTNFLQVGPIAIDRERHRVSVNGQETELTAIEFKLLSTLMERVGRVLTRETLLSAVWGMETNVESRTVDTHLRRLREKLGAAGEQIRTVRGFGYRIDEVHSVR